LPVVDGGTLQSRSDRLIFSTTTLAFTVEAFLSKTHLYSISLESKLLKLQGVSISFATGDCGDRLSRRKPKASAEAGADGIESDIYSQKNMTLLFPPTRSAMLH
jgi:hypothetical protein